MSELDEPRVFERLFRREPGVGVDHKQLLNECFGFVRDLLKLFVLEVKLGRMNFVKYYVSVLALEWQIATQ